MTLRRVPGTVAAAAPVALAIGVFGVVYGAAADDVLGPVLAVASSVLIFSGAAQFTMVALLAAGASPAGVLAGVAPLALRHLPLGAIMAPRLPASRTRRALVSWFLIDETAGVALAGAGPVERTMAVTGGLSYLAWVTGTTAGVGARRSRASSRSPTRCSRSCSSGWPRSRRRTGPTPRVPASPA